MASKDIYLKFSVDKNLYHDVMAADGTGGARATSKKRGREAAHPAVEFVDLVKEHLDESGRQDVVVVSSIEPEGGKSRRLNFNLDFRRTPAPIILRDDVFQAEPMADFLATLAVENGPDAVVSMLRDVMYDEAGACYECGDLESEADCSTTDDDGYSSVDVDDEAALRVSGGAKVKPLLPELLGC